MRFPARYLTFIFVRFVHVRGASFTDAAVYPMRYTRSSPRTGSELNRACVIDAPTGLISQGYTLRMKARFVLRVLLSWLPLAALAVTLASMSYLGIEQSHRTAADDPQLAIAQEAAVTLGRGTLPSTIVPEGRVVIGESLAVYLNIYDGQGLPVAGSGYLHGDLPKLPPGVFSAAAAWGENRITWQPEPGIRQAIVAVPFGEGPAGYAVAGRSLSEVEKRERALTAMTGGALGAGLLVTLLLVALRERYG